MGAGASLTRWAPGVGVLRTESLRSLRVDVIAGVTVASYLVPQCMAYGQLAGLTPVAGLWAALLPITVYVLVGSSRHLSVGPETTTALMTAAAIGPLAGSDPARYAFLAAVLAVLIGLVCLVARVARLGFMADLLSRPILLGYMAGVALLMVGGQLKRLTGVPITGSSLAGQASGLWRGLHLVNAPTVCVSATVLVFLMVMRWRFPRFPAPLVAVIASSAVVALLHLEGRGVALVGDIAAGLPPFSVPRLGMHELGLLGPSAAAIALVGYSDNVLTARSFLARGEPPIDANQELVALGLANIGAGLSGGFPVSSSGTRTAIGVLARGRTQFAGVVTAIALLLVLWFAHPLLAAFPVPALGAIVVAAALRLIDLPGLVSLGRFRINELLLALTTMAGVVFLDVLPGIGVAVFLSAADLLARVARPHDAVLGRVPELGGLHDVVDFPEATTTPGLVMYRYDAPVFFANAGDFRRRLMAVVDEESANQRVEWVVVNADAIVDIDTTAAAALREVAEELDERGITFGLARVKQELLGWIERAGLLEVIPPEHLFRSLSEAVEAFRNRNLGAVVDDRGTSGSETSGSGESPVGGAPAPGITDTRGEQTPS